MQLTAQQFATVVQGLRDAEDSGSSDTRKVSRMAVQASVTVGTLADGKLTDRFTALTQDVSMGGLALLQSVPVNMGCEVIVDLPGGGGRGKDLVVLATVAHCRPVVRGIYSVGLVFVRALVQEPPKPAAAAPTAAPGPGAAAPAPVVTVAGAGGQSEAERARIRSSILD